MNKIDLKTLSESQRKLIEDFGVEFKLNTNGKMYMVSTPIYDEYIKNRKTEEIKQMYQDAIYSRYSQTDQNNTNARITEINTLKLLENRDFTTEEILEIEAGRTMINWIREQISLCDLEISKL